MAALRAELTEAQRRRREATLALQEAQGPRAERAAQDADAQAYAIARRSGRNAPEPKHVQALQERIVEAQRIARGEAATAAAIEAEMHALIDGRREAWRADLEERLSELRPEILETLASLRDLFDAWHRLDQVSAWLRRGRAKAALPRVPGLVSRTGVRGESEAYTLPRVLEALEAAFTARPEDPHEPEEAEEDAAD